MMATLPSPTTTNNSASTSSLVPSQAIRAAGRNSNTNTTVTSSNNNSNNSTTTNSSNNNNNNTNNNNRNRRNKNRRRNIRNNNKNGSVVGGGESTVISEGGSQGPMSDNTASASSPQPSSNNNNSSSNNNNNTNNNNTKSRRRRNNKNRKNNRNQQEKQTEGGDGEEHTTTTDDNDQQQQQQQQQNKNQQKNNQQQQQQQQQKGGGKKKKGNNNNNKNKKPRKRYPWRRHIPQGTVDPITLDPLVSLPYPPFALVASEPYEPVPIWPIPEKNNNSKQQQRKGQKNDNDVEEINRRRLQEQWGDKSLNKDNNEDITKDEQSSNNENTNDNSKVHYHLYDGRALAFYIVSQLQFIDPLNRRDLTRNELLNLDKYLRRHGFNDLKVIDAYDAKGITLSSAGAAAHTAQGRAEILQQTATVLLNSLFGNNSVTAAAAGSGGNNTNTNNNDNSLNHNGRANNNNNNDTATTLQEQYAELQRQEQSRALQQQQHFQQQQQQQFHYQQDPFFSTGNNNNHGLYASDDGGLVVIDDDENPGLRGNGFNDGNLLMGGVPGMTGSFGSYHHQPQQQVNSLYSASHITNLHRQGGGVSMGQNNFPALPTPPAPAPNTNSSMTQPSSTELTTNTNTNNAKKAAVSKTLARISGAVKKTDPEEVQRHWEAREEARKKAMMSNLAFGVDPTNFNIAQPQPLPATNYAAASLSSVKTSMVASDDKLQRNRAFAEALGVQPATVRQNNYNSGWARPINNKIDLDEFGNELNAAIYNDTIISQARERMTLILKIEKRWKAFLSDDTSASLPLSPMDRPSRALIHAYSDFWKLRTESFDPEPKRYIHCVKMLDTHMPHPLLSDVARNWRGPTPTSSSTSLIQSSETGAAVGSTTTVAAIGSDHPSQQTAGQNTRSREIPPPPDRVPLPLKPRSVTPNTSRPTTPTRSGSRSPPPRPADSSSRFGSLFNDRERPKLELAKRTVPLELPPFQPQEKYSVNNDELAKKRRAKLEEKAQRENKLAQQKMRALQDAFASDSDDDEKNEIASHDSSDWGEEQEPLYHGSDDDDF